MAHSVGDFARRDWQASLPSGFEFWLKIFGVAFGLGVVSGIVMAFELGIK